MTIEEAYNIKVGDRVWVSQPIRYGIRGKRIQVYKPNKFYEVLDVIENPTYITVVIQSEIGILKVIIYNEYKVGVPVSIPTMWVQFFQLVKQDDYLQISSIDYFV